MIDCCEDKAKAREHGLFEGPVGDDWYLCECKKKKLQPKAYHPILEKLSKILGHF